MNDWDCEFRDKLLACGSGGTTVACSSRGTSRNSCRMNRVFSIFLLLPVMAIVICRGKPSEVCSSTQTWHPGSGWALRRIRPSFGLSCKDGGERLHRQNGSLRRRSAIRCCGERMPCHSHQMGHSQQGVRLRSSVTCWVAQEFSGRCGDKHEYFSETPGISTLKRRETPLSSCRTMCLPNAGQRMLGSCARRCTELTQLQHRGEMSSGKHSSAATSLLEMCRVAASTTNCAPSRGRCMAMTFLSLVRVRI